MENCNDETKCGGRREFLVKAGVTVGGMVLSLSSMAKAQDKSAVKSETADDVVLKIDAKSGLNKIGGSETIDTKAGKVIVVRLADADFKAYSAVCPHKGGPIKYDEATNQLFCPWHNSRFDRNGDVVKGPAKTGLPNYQTENAVAVMIKS